jgi:RimJ/RimL family protein N-acetyltransferase
MDIYEVCPRLESHRFLLRQTDLNDCSDLLKVYSDPAAWPIFNSDNCTGNFQITTPEDMENCIRFWLSEYAQRYYIRWSIVDKGTQSAIGTVELFNRSSRDFYNNVGLLRLDLRSDYETADAIQEVLSILIPRSFELFSCSRIATKIPTCAQVRISTLTAFGFHCSREPLYSHDGTAYGDYYILDA